MKKMDWLIVGCLLVLGFNSGAYGQRPFSTCDAGVGGMGENAVETAWELVKEDNSYSNSMMSAFIFGLGRTEIVIEAPFVFTGEETGISEVIFCGKMLILGSDENSGLITIKVGYASPGKSYGVTLIGSKILGKFLFHNHLGWSHDFLNNSFVFGTAVEFKIVTGFSLASEIFGDISSELNKIYYKGGFLYKPAEFVTFDFVAGSGITENIEDFFVTVGSTFSFY